MLHEGGKTWSEGGKEMKAYAPLHIDISLHACMHIYFTAALYFMTQAFRL